MKVEPPIIPDEIWEGAAGYTLRIVDVRRDGRVVCERIAGPSGPFLTPSGRRPEITVHPDQLRGPFRPTGKFDFGLGQPCRGR